MIDLLDGTVLRTCRLDIVREVPASPGTAATLAPSNYCQDGVAAKGIHSGGGSFLGGCTEYFTGIQHPIQALPGGVPSLP